MQVFVSYSSVDREAAEAVLAALEAAGFRCWIAPRDIVPGADWGGSIVSAISGSRVLVLVWSAHSNASPQVLREVERAVSKRVTVLPFRIEDVPPTGSMEYFLGACHWLDAFEGSRQEHLAELVAAVRSALDQPAPAPPAPARKPRGGCCWPVVALALFLGLLVAGGAAWRLANRNPRRAPQPVASTSVPTQPPAQPPPRPSPSPSPRPSATLTRLDQPRVDRVASATQVRERPAQASAARASLDAGQLVLVTEEGPDWRRVLVSPGVSGYVPRAATRPTDVRLKGVATIQDPDGYTNVRSGPALDKRILGRVNQGEFVFVLGAAGEWAHVVTRSGLEGYMHRSRLRPVRP